MVRYGGETFARLLTLYPIVVHIGNMATKTKSIKIRLEDWEYEKYSKWAETYGDNLSSFFRRLLRSLPENPPEIPQPTTLDEIKPT